MSRVFLWRAWAVTPRLTRAIGQVSGWRLDVEEMLQHFARLAVGQGLHAARTALHLLRALAHVVALVAVAGENLAAAGDLESLLGPGLGLHLGHFCLLKTGRQKRR